MQHLHRASRAAVALHAPDQALVVRHHEHVAAQLVPQEPSVANDDVVGRAALAAQREHGVAAHVPGALLRAVVEYEQGRKLRLVGPALDERAQTALRRAEELCASQVVTVDDADGRTAGGARSLNVGEQRTRGLQRAGQRAGSKHESERRPRHPKER